MNNMNRRNVNPMRNRQVNNNQMLNQNRVPQNRGNIDLAYPVIKVSVKPNITYARIILYNIGGCASEMTAIALYAYNHVVFMEYEDVSAAFERINI